MSEAPQSNWSEYARLVLNELERLNKTEERHAQDISALRNDLSLHRQHAGERLGELERRLSRLDDDQNPASVVARLRRTEDADLGELTIRKWRWGILVFAVGLLSSIVIPIVALILSQRG